MNFIVHKIDPPSPRLRRGRHVQKAKRRARCAGHVAGALLSDAIPV